MQYSFVKQHGCDEVQGFLFGRPVPGEQIEKLLAAKVVADSVDVANDMAAGKTAHGAADNQ